MNIYNEETMEPLFWILEQNKGVVQEERYHPEGDVFVHSLQTMQWAFRETFDTDLILAAMLHDVGKVAGSLGHDNYAVEFLDCHCSTKTLWLIKNHMRIWYFILGEMHKLKKIRDLIEHPWFPELIHLARFDKMARNPNRKVIYDKEHIMDRLNNYSEKHFRLG